MNTVEKQITTKTRVICTYFVTVISVLALLNGMELYAQSDKNASADTVKAVPIKDFYRPIGFSIGICYNRLSGVGAQDRYIEETDSYDATRLSGKTALGFSIGMHIWRQRTHLQLEVGWTKGEFFEEGGFRSTTNGGTVDTYIDIGYFVGGFRLKQALITRRLLITGGWLLVEEGRSRHAKTRSKGKLVESSSFPTDEFYLWSIGLDIQIAQGLYFGYSYSWTYNQNDFDPIYGRIGDPPIMIDGFTINAFQLTFAY